MDDSQPKNARALDSERDQAAVTLFRNGDARAFDELVRRYQRPVYYLCLRYLKNEADAKDVTQRAFVRAFRALDKFRGDASFRTWLYRIAINQSLNYLRDHKRERASEFRDDGAHSSAGAVHNATGANRIIGEQRSAQLREAIAALPDKQRMVLELRIYDELPFRDVAELADCSENAAKVNFHHAVKKLRAWMTDGDTCVENTKNKERQ